MFEDYTTVDYCTEPRVVNAICDLPTQSHTDMWFPCCRGQLFRMIEWTAVFLDRLDTGRPVDLNSLTGHPIAGRG